MKILIIDDCVDLIGGVERVICTLANELIEDNYVEILNQYRLVDKSFYDYDKRVKKEYLFDKIVKSREYSTNSIRFVYFKALEKLKFALEKRRLIDRYLKKCKDFDIIVFGRISCALDFLPLIKKHNIKSKIIVRDAIFLDFYSKRMKQKIKVFFAEMVNTLIVSSDESIKAYKDLIKDDKIEIVKIYNPLGIKPIKKYNFKSKEIVSIGRMSDDQKGFDNLIKAFDIVYESHPDWKLKIYGDGKKKQVYNKMIMNLESKKNIQLLPSTKDVVKVFNDSAIFVLASRYEGYANILVEALSCGIPSISYNWLMGVEEIIKDNENGIIVKLKDRMKYFNGKTDQEDCENMAKKICYLIENGEIANNLSKNAEKIIENREPGLILKKWLKLFQE